MTGNTHTLVLSKHRARIRTEFGRSPDLIVSPVELRQALLDWRALLEGNPPIAAGRTDRNR
jgi:hypothetical protein